jgi:hypothetical protein
VALTGTVAELTIHNTLHTTLQYIASSRLAKHVLMSPCVLDNKMCIDLALCMSQPVVVLTGEKKPVIASMGDVAASGGYYISMVCRKRAATVGTRPHALMLSSLRPLSVVYKLFCLVQGQLRTCLSVC